MKKLFLLLVLPLFMLSCSSDDEDNRTLNEKLDDALLEVSGGKVYDYRNHTAITDDVKDTDLYKQQQGYLKNATDSLNRVEPNNIEEYNQQKKNVEYTKQLVDKLEQNYTIPSYTIDASVKRPTTIDTVRFYFNDRFNYLGNIDLKK